MAIRTAVALCKNLSSCVYIGNTSSLDDATLLRYCSTVENVVSFLFMRPKFSDFHIVEFSTPELADRFVKTSHTIDGISLDVRFYKDLLRRTDHLNMDQKLFVGPIRDANGIESILQFYKKIDRKLTHSSSIITGKRYILIKFSSGEFTNRVIDKELIPSIRNQESLAIEKVFHPKNIVYKIFSLVNESNQVYIRGLTHQIDEAMLIDYFKQRATINACHIFSNDSSCAIVEFDDQKSFNQLLSLPVIRLNGIPLSLSKISTSLRLLLSSDVAYTRNIISEANESTIAQTEQKFSTTNSLNFVNPTAPFIGIPISSTVNEDLTTDEINQSQNGWSSPPRNIEFRCSSHEPPTNDPSQTPTPVADLDFSSNQKATSFNGLLFFERIQKDIDELRDEYRLKFERSRRCIEQEVDRMILDERRALSELTRYLKDHRRRSEKRFDYKRKYSPDSLN